MDQRDTESASAGRSQDAAEGAATWLGGRMEYVETLSLREQFRLVEIAHETSDSDIKEAALAVLKKYLNPLVRLV